MLPLESSFPSLSPLSVLSPSERVREGEREEIRGEEQGGEEGGEESRGEGGGEETKGEEGLV